jgi:moderate conductance mechanosensitive channel
MQEFTRLLGFDARFVVYPIGALIAAIALKLIIHRYMRKWVQRTKSEIDDKILNYIESLIIPVLLLSVLHFISAWLPLSTDKIGYIRKGIIVAAILLITFYSARLLSGILSTLETSRESWQRFTQPLRMLSNVFFILIAVALSLKTFKINFTDEGIRLIRIIGVVVGAFVLLRIINLAVTHMQHLVERKDATSLSETEKRARTLGKIVNSTGFVFVVGVAIMMILSEFGINILPIITGAGIAGLAVGFGAQNLVRDIISGFFLILEDQIRVGDVVKINGVAGSVEAINLRTTVLRDLEGIVYIFPNGEIKQVANMSKEFAYSVVSVGVSYKENVDRVMEVLKSTGDELARDANFSSLILEPIEILGVESLGDSSVKIQMRFKTFPLQQWTVGRELRRRIKNTFDSQGIEIPFPYVSVGFDETSKPFTVAIQAARNNAAEGKEE